MERYQQAGISTIATEARLRRFEKVSQILSKLEVYAGKHSSRAKTSNKGRQRLFASHQRSSTSRQLRTTKLSYPPNRTTFPNASTETPKGNKRTSHNLVEKQYAHD
jgi:hypothetical protein